VLTVVRRQADVAPGWAPKDAAGVQHDALTSKLEAGDWEGVAADFSPDSDTVLIVFGGIVGQIEIPFFEFAKVTAPLGVKKVYVRDHEQAWYHKGVMGAAENIDALVGYLRRQIQEHGCRRVVTLGNSMGAYAAILTGCQLPADEVVAFSPQTFIGRFRRLLRRVGRWSRQLSGAYRSRSAQRAYFNLRSVLRRKSGATTYHLYYAKGNRLDACHAEHLAGLPGVHLHPVDLDGHRMVRVLRDSGRLIEILQGALDGSS
jgi:pimeloyl-ACP methyl ester carboxylesterase